MNNKVELYLRGVTLQSSDYENCQHLPEKSIIFPVNNPMYQLVTTSMPIPIDVKKINGAYDVTCVPLHDEDVELLSQEFVDSFETMMVIGMPLKANF